MAKIETIEDPAELKGIVGKSPLLELNNFSFVGQIGLDYLHNYCLGNYYVQSV